MGKRRKNIRTPKREQIKELLKVKTPKEIYEMFYGTRDQMGLTSIYNIQRDLKQEETRPQKPLGSPYKGEFETPDVGAILLAPGLERQHKIWILVKWPSLGLEKGEIAELVGDSLEDIKHAIEETGKLVSKTKEESRMEQNQSMLNLPPWVNQAQWEHLEGREVTGWTEGREIVTGVVTYPGGLGIRQQLVVFEGCFPDIHPRSRPFYRPLDDENVMVQLRGHLPDEAFWERVEGSEGFIKKAKECEALLDAASERFTSAGEELAPLRPSRGPEPDAYITSGWVRQVLVRALSRELGFSEPDKYYPSELKDGGFILEDDGLIYRGPDAVAAEQKHRELVKGFIKSEEFPSIVNLTKDLCNLRQQILARIGQCLRKREYSFNYCPDCPADQARKMLTSKGE